MVPASISSNLSSLRQRERLLSLTWGIACWLAVVVALLLVCCFVDWLVDRQRDTPFSVRFVLFLIQAGSALIAGGLLIVVPQLRRLPDDLLALMVEDKISTFDHRLISAVQLNRPNAPLAGMSPELIAIMTKEAERESDRVSFASVADHSRLKWSAYVLGPVLVVALLPMLIWPGVVFALLARQALLPVDVPHSVTLESASPEYWPVGDDLTIQLRVTGAFDEKMVGTVSVTPEGQGTSRYELRFLSRDDKGAIFGAEISARDLAGDAIRYSARMHDGRTKLPSVIRLVARPTLAPNNPKAWLIYPEFCSPEKDMPRFEKPQSRGDVVGILESSVRVEAETARPVKSAWVVLLGPDKAEPKSGDAEARINEIPKAKLEMKVEPIERIDDRTGDKSMASRLSVTFDLREGVTGYRILLKDEHDFENAAPQPRRSLRVVPEDAPQVGLLRVTFGSGGDFDVEGLPVVIGGRIRIPYAATGAYGLGKAEVLYRVLKKQESGNEPAEEEKWITLGLTEAHADNDSGPFDPKTGVFQKTGFEKQVMFHAVPRQHSADLGRTIGGGRYFLETKGLVERKGGIQTPIKIKSGDQIEYFVKVYGMPRAKGEVPFGQSETRVSTMMDANEFLTWIQQVGREDERVRQLELDQRRIFERKQ